MLQLAHVVGLLGHVPGDDQPVAGIGGVQVLDDRLVLGAVDVEVAGREQPGGHRVITIARSGDGFPRRPAPSLSR